MEYAFIDLLNSDWHDWRGSGKSEDLLNRKDWVDEFLSKWNLQISLVDYAELCPELKALRTLISSITKNIITGAELTSIDIERLNAVLSNVLYSHQFAAFSQADHKVKNRIEADSEVPSASSRLILELKPVKKDINWILAKITESFVEVLTNRDPKRLKICANPDCGWFFYDESRGLTRNWCDSKICGNLMKVRRFRQKCKQDGHS